MTLAELTDPEVVRQAIKEYDAMGGEAFLRKYGFGAESKYWLQHRGRRYQSKAIAGAAHKHQTGKQLSSFQFSGGKGNGAAGRLRRLGFEVIGPEDHPPMDVLSAFEVMWIPSKWRWAEDEVVSMQQLIVETGRCPDRWSTSGRKRGINPGDRIFLFQAGNGERGLIGSAHATSTIYSDAHWDADMGGDANYIDLEWDALLSSADMLPWGEIEAAIPKFPRQFRSNAQELDLVQVEQLTRLWRGHLSQVLGPGPELDTDIPAEYRWVIAKQRIHQDKFRELLLAKQRRACCVCGLDQVQVLEAAHVIPDALGGGSTLENGRLMCANHHRAHDAGLLQLDLWDRPTWKPGITPFP